MSTAWLCAPLQLKQVFTPSGQAAGVGSKGDITPVIVGVMGITPVILDLLLCTCLSSPLLHTVSVSRDT